MRQGSIIIMTFPFPLNSRGGILSRRVEMEKVREAVEANQTELEKDSFIDLIKSSFYDYQILISQKKAVLSLRQALELHNQKLSDLYAEGLVKKTDLLETKSSLEETDMNINDLDQAINKVRIDFHRMCGHYPEEIDPEYKEAEQSEEQALDYFKNNHPVLRTMQDQKKVLELQKKIISGKYLPSINGFAELHYGIDVSIQKLENQRDDFIKDITRTLRQLYSAKESLDQKKANIENMIAYSKEDAELKKELYEEKQIPNVDYLAALQSEKKYEAMKDELSLQVEKINVKINTLISRTKEYGL